MEQHQAGSAHRGSRDSVERVEGMCILWQGERNGHSSVKDDMNSQVFNIGPQTAWVAWRGTEKERRTAAAARRPLGALARLLQTISAVLVAEQATPVYHLNQITFHYITFI